MKSQSILKTIGAIATAFTAALCSCNNNDADNDTTIRIGHFPNVTHAQALVARNMERHGNQWLTSRLPEGYKLKWYTYNAGPDAMEAVFARSIDVTYVGPSPAINAYTKANGREIRIISGAANGASALVVQPHITTPEASQLIGAKIATPQLGNTQDVACRAWLRKLGFSVNLQGAKAPSAITSRPGYKTPDNGVDVTLVPTPNPEQLSLFQRKQLTAVWTVEPWISRLELEAGGKVLIDDKEAITTVLASSVQFLQNKPEVARKLIRLNEELTQWIIDHPEEAQNMVIEELQTITKTKISPDLIRHAWNRVGFTSQVAKEGIENFVEDAKTCGLLGNVPDINGLIYTDIPANTRP